jgi:hypothetical protein
MATIPVQFFTIEQTRSSTAISRIAYAFGADIPHPMPWEGGRPGIRYLFCTRTSTPVEEICKQHSWTLTDKPSLQEVPEEMFNYKSRASIQYGNGQTYTLICD